MKPVLSVIKEVHVHGIAHITGGGFYENMPRAVSGGLGFDIKKGTWDMPAIFPLLQRLGNVPEHDMYNVYNMGVGMILIVDKADEAKTLDILKNAGENPHVIGFVKKGEGVDIHD